MANHVATKFLMWDLKWKIVIFKLNSGNYSKLENTKKIKKNIMWHNPMVLGLGYSLEICVNESMNIIVIKFISVKCTNILIQFIVRI